MSRRRGEFEHRTSIFEGAFRAWSHLGGLEPEEVESKPSSELDPLTYQRGRAGKETPDGRREYPYEPLPRSGLAHPYVQAILSPWLGPDADNDAIQLGLTTLRTWWQHRRKGESGSAVAALGTEKMRGVVEGYTRHFFTLAHCLIINDKEQPPRTLHTKMKELDKIRNKRKKRSRDDPSFQSSEPPFAPSCTQGDADPSAGPGAALNDSNLTPLERLHAAQRRQLAESGGVHSAPGVGISGGGGGGNGTGSTTMHNGQQIPLIDIKQKCLPGKVNLPAVVEEVNHYATQLAHRGRGNNIPVALPVVGHGSAPGPSPGSVSGSGSEAVPNAVGSTPGAAADSGEYGDPQASPVVFVSENWDVLLSMVVDGITCAHCVKIVETVLKGCNGNKSPIDGLLDAAADRTLCSVLIKIDKISNAKRVAFEAARNLAMVGYTAKPKEMSLLVERDGSKVQLEWDTIFNAFEVVGQRDPQDIFDWSAPCSCPDNGVLRDDCPRHSQMNDSIFEAFEQRSRLVSQYIASGKLSNVSSGQGQQQFSNPDSGMAPPANTGTMLNGQGAPPSNGNGYFGANSGQGSGFGMNNQQPPNGAYEPHQVQNPNNNEVPTRSAQRNPSIFSFGDLRMSDRASFGRAMSSLSALSIDWENIGDDFDINVDHSAHINNGGSPHAPIPGMLGGSTEQVYGSSIGRRSSLRRPFPSGDQDNSQANNRGYNGHISNQYAA